MSDLAPGTLLHQRYRMLRPLGKGGMGTVYEAIDTRLHNTVAVKQTTIDGDEARGAFEREARLLAALRHPALPVVIDYFAENDGQFLVMQYIEGEDLAHLLERQGRPFDAGELVRCASALAGALDYLHRREPPIVHRDLKPANVNRTPSGDYVLLDFGLAKGRGDPDTTVAVDERSVYGFTPTYAPPEQIQGLPTDPRSDVFALGATLFHLAVGAPPLPALERLGRAAAGMPDPLGERLMAASGLDSRMRSVIARALALSPGERFQSAAEILTALADSEAPQRAPAPDTATGERRVDAALPAEAEVGRAIDLIVQVRFADSPLLGVEDWPSRRRPERIEQSSETLDLVFPVDPATGTRQPARIRVRLVAPDFTLAGSGEQLVAVPPRDYSKRLAFLLTPTRAGVCRVNVEVYAPDAAFLGVLAIEAEAFDRPVREVERRVANLDLRVVSGAPSPRDEAMPTSVRVELPPPQVRAVVERALSATAAAPHPPVAPPAGSAHIGRWIAAASALVVLIAAGVTMLVPHDVNSPGTVQQTEPAPPPLAPPPASGGTGASQTVFDAVPRPPSPRPPSAPASSGSTDAGRRSTAAAAAPPSTPPTQPQPPAEVKAPISDEDYAKNAIKDVLTQLCKAYEDMSSERVQEVFPTVNIELLRRQLNKSQYEKVVCSSGDPTFESLDATAGKAAIKVETKRIFMHSTLDPEPDVTEQIADMKLSRASARGRWVIDSVVYRPKPKDQ